MSDDWKASPGRAIRHCVKRVHEYFHVAHALERREKKRFIIGSLIEVAESNKLGENGVYRPYSFAYLADMSYEDCVRIETIVDRYKHALGVFVNEYLNEIITIRNYCERFDYFSYKIFVKNLPNEVRFSHSDIGNVALKPYHKGGALDRNIKNPYFG